MSHFHAEATATRRGEVVTLEIKGQPHETVEVEQDLLHRMVSDINSVADLTAQRDQARNIAAKLEAELATQTAILQRVAAIINADEVKLGQLCDLQDDVNAALGVTRG